MTKRTKRPRISARTREQAATICAIAASSHWLSSGSAQDAIGASDEALALAFDACMSASEMTWRLDWAEAEARLRTGWSP